MRPTWGPALVQMLVGACALLALGLVFSPTPSAQRANDAPASAGPAILGPSYLPGPNIELTVNGTRFSLPRDYVMSATTSGHTGFIVLARWPEMAGITQSTETEFAHPGTRNIVMIFAESTNASADRAIEVWLELALRLNVGPAEPHQTSFGLREFRAIGLRPGYEDNIGRDDYFIPVIPLTEQVHIVCTSHLGLPPGGGGRQICSEVTEFANIRIKITYDRELLPNWRAIHDRTIELLDALQQN